MAMVKSRALSYGGVGRGGNCFLLTAGLRTHGRLQCSPRAPCEPARGCSKAAAAPSSAAGPLLSCAVSHGQPHLTSVRRRFSRQTSERARTVPASLAGMPPRDFPSRLAAFLERVTRSPSLSGAFSGSSVAGTSDPFRPLWSCAVPDAIPNDIYRFIVYSWRFRIVGSHMFDMSRTDPLFDFCIPSESDAVHLNCRRFAT